MRTLVRLLMSSLVLIGCVGCDQVSKAAARHYLPGTGVHSFLADTFRLEYAQNPGAFLSLGDGLSPALRYTIFIVVLGALVAAMLGWATLSARLTPLQRIALVAMGAGGVGNIIDRIRFDGAVTDFLNLGIGSLRTGIFNVADATLLVGAIVLLLGRSRRS